MSKFYHAAGKRRSYFEGWYCKCLTADGQALALIPALHIDAAGRRSASLQVITKERSWWLDYPAEQFAAAKERFSVHLGPNSFSEHGISLDIAAEGLSLRGELYCSAFRPLHSDIMGPFRLLADMECAHGVLSMGHGLSGRLWLNGELWDFCGGCGYIETDRGRSFPRQYLWTQSSSVEAGAGAGLMLAIATIPLPPLSFTGVICAATAGGREYRLATYHGARIEHWDEQAARIRQGPYRLAVELLQAQPQPLKAPVGGDMQRTVHESLCATVQYRLWRGEELLLQRIDDRAGFEYAAGDS